MTKKELINAINKDEFKSVKVRFDDNLEDTITIKCSLGKLILRSWNSYEEISDLLLEKGFTKGNDYYNRDNIIFVKKV